MLGRLLSIRRCGPLAPAATLATSAATARLLQPPLRALAGGSARRERQSRRRGEDEDEMTIVDVDFGRPHEWWVLVVAFVET